MKKYTERKEIISSVLRQLEGKLDSVKTLDNVKDLQSVKDCIENIYRKRVELCEELVEFCERYKQNRSTWGCSKLKMSVDMTSSGKNGLNIRTNASPKWDRTRCPEE